MKWYLSVLWAGFDSIGNSWLFMREKMNKKLNRYSSVLNVCFRRRDFSDVLTQKFRVRVFTKSTWLPQINWWKCFRVPFPDFMLRSELFRKCEQAFDTSEFICQDIYFHHQFPQFYLSTVLRSLYVHRFIIFSRNTNTS